MMEISCGEGMITMIWLLIIFNFYVTLKNAPILILFINQDKVLIIYHYYNVNNNSEPCVQIELLHRDKIPVCNHKSSQCHASYPTFNDRPKLTYPNSESSHYPYPIY